MLCLLLVFLCGVMSEGIRIHLDFNACCIIQMFLAWGSLTILMLPWLQVSIVPFKVIHLRVYALGSSHLLQLGGLYTGQSASPTSGSSFETPALWCYTAAWLVSRFVLYQLVCISLVSATNGFEIQCYYFCSYVLLFSFSQHFLYLRHPHFSLQCHAVQSKLGWVSLWGF